MTVSNKGLGVTLSDYVDGLMDIEGYFAERKKGDDSINLLGRGESHLNPM